MKAVVLLFGVVSYLIFFGTFLYQIGFVANWGVPKGIDSGAVVSLPQAIGINLVLLSLFAVQHTIMARTKFKESFTKVVSPAIERSIFVLLSSLILLLMNWQWCAMPEYVWHVESQGGRIALWTVSMLGWGLVLVSTFLINHFDLFGLRQVWLHYKGIEYTDVQFRETTLYSWVRHPIMVGFIIAFWATPDMTQGHLLFAAVTTGYILVGIQIEERTLVGLLGDSYREYQKRVSQIIPMPPKAAAP